MIDNTKEPEKDENQTAKQLVDAVTGTEEPIDASELLEGDELKKALAEAKAQLAAEK